MKKLLLGIGTLVTIVTPLTAVVACSTEEDALVKVSSGAKKENVDRKFVDVSVLQDSIDQSLMFDSLGNEIRDISTSNILSNRIISKIELDKTDNIVRLTYKDTLVDIGESEDESGVANSAVRITIQLGDSPKIIKIERLSEDGDVFEDVTSKEKSNFDETKVSEIINKKLFEDYPVDGIHVLDQGKRMNSLFLKNREAEAGCKHVQISDKTIALAKEIRKIMNDNPDSQWHTYGDGILDGANAVRLAIYNDIKGDRKLKEKIRAFADEPFKKWRGARDLKNTNQYEEFCKMQINDWFDSKAGMPNLIGDWHFWAEMGKAGKANDWEGMKKAFRPEHVEQLDVKKYKALTLGTEEILTTEHRTQEFDWLGNFDGHGHSKTIQKINDNVTKNGNDNTGEYAKAPIGDEGIGAENYVFNYTYNDHKFSEGADFISGLLSAIDVLYDYADGGRETGHRTNLFGQQWSTFGWSWHAANSSNWQYMVTRVGQEDTTPVTGVEDIKTKNPFLNKYSIAMLKHVPPMDYLYRTCEWDKNDYFALPGGWRDWFGTKINAIFHKSHKSFSDLWADIVTVIGEDNNAKTRYKEPKSMVEVPRVAKQQIVGRPDTWIHTYDYNGGGTITGHQYGYSPLEEDMFE